MDWMGAPAVVNNKVYLFGGYVSGTASNMALEYDPATDSWNTKAYMPSARYAPATAVYNNKIYVMGGNYGNKNNEMYDPETNTWRPRPNFLSATTDGVAGEINGKLLLIHLPTNGCYSPTSDSWISIGGLNTPRHNLTGEVVNEKLFVLGGGYLFNNFDLVDIYTPSDLQSASFQTKSDAVYKIEVDDSYMSDFFLQETHR